MATDLCNVCGAQTTRTPTGNWQCEPCDGITALRDALANALRERDEAWRQLAYWDAVTEKISHPCHCCGGDVTDWTGYYSAEGTEECRVFLCNHCSTLFLAQVMDHLNYAQCQYHLRQAKKDLRFGDVPRRTDANNTD